MLACTFFLLVKGSDRVFGELPEPIPFQLERITPVPGISGCDALDQRATTPSTARFRATPGSTPDLFVLRADARHLTAVLVLDNIPDRVRLFSCGPGGQTVTVAQGGTSIPQSAKPFLSTLTALPIQAADPEATNLLWVENVSVLPFGLLVLKEADFQQYSDRKLLIHVGFISAIVLMIIYNLALAFSSGISTFLFNALSIFSILLISLYRNGTGMAYLWPELPQLNPWILIMGLAGATAFAPFYLYRFLVPFEENLLAARPTILLWPLMVLGALSTSLFLHLVWVTMLVLILFNTLVIIVTVQLAMATYRRQETAAVFLVIAMGAILPGVVAGGLRELAGLDFGVLNPHLMELGLMFEAPAFTIVLAFLILRARQREVLAIQALNELTEKSKQQLLDALDRDRTRLASDLHDSSGQMLGLVLSRLKGMAQSSPPSDIRKVALEEVTGRVRETLGELRRISHDLHPATLTHLGLKRAITAMCKEFSRAGSLRIHCIQEYDEADLDPVQQLQIYRIFQEIIANANRHSGATDATLEISSGESKFKLQFSDNGIGHTASGVGFGLGRSILNQRVERLGGTQRTSTGDFGTTVTITFDAEKSI